MGSCWPCVPWLVSPCSPSSLLVLSGQTQPSGRRWPVDDPAVQCPGTADLLSLPLHVTSEGTG